MISRVGRVAPSALAWPRLEYCTALIQITSQDPSKAQGYAPRRSRSTVHEVAKYQSMADRWAARSIPLNKGVSSSAAWDRWSKQDRLDSCTSRGGMRALSSNERRKERPGGRPLRYSVPYRRILPQHPAAIKGRDRDRIEADTSCPDDCTSRARVCRAKMRFCFAGRQPLFILGNLGVSAEPARLPSYETCGDVNIVQHRVRPLPAGDTGVAVFY